MTLKIIPAPRSLKPQIEKLCQQTFAEHQARQPDAFASNNYDILFKPFIDAAFQRPPEKPIDEGPVILAAMRNDEMVGYIHLMPIGFANLSSTVSISIGDIHVVEGHRGTGVGESLLNHVKALAEEQDWHDLTATVWSGNNASQALFERCGFAQRNVTMRYGPDRQAANLTPIDRKTRGGIAPIIFSWLPVIVIVLLYLLFK